MAHSHLHSLLNFAALHLLAEPWRAANRCFMPVIRMKVKPMVILRTVCPGYVLLATAVSAPDATVWAHYRRFSRQQRASSVVV